MAVTTRSARPVAEQRVENGNFHHLVMDIFWFGLALPATSRFMAVYALRVGASTMQIGWLSALPALVLLVSTLLSDRWRRRYPDAAQATVLPGLGFRFAFLLPAFTPLIAAEWQPMWLILSVTLPALPQGISSVTFLVMMREAVSVERISALVSRRMLVLNATLGISTVILGVWLIRMPFPFNYQAMFVLAFALTLISLWHVKQTRPVFEMPVTRPVPVMTALRDADFREVIKAVIGIHLAFFFAAPLIPVYLIDQLGANESFIALFVFVELTAGAAMAAVLPRITKKTGHRALLFPAMVGLAVSTATIVLIPHLSAALVGAALTGAAWTMAGVAMFGFFSEKTTRDQVASYTMIYNQAAFLSVFVAPLLSSILADGVIDIAWVLLAGAGLRLLVGVSIQLAGSKKSA